MDQQIMMRRKSRTRHDGGPDRRSEMGIAKAAKLMGISLESYRAKLAEGLKACNVCHEWKALDCFNIDRSRVDGRVSKCRDCQNQIGRDGYSPKGPRAKGRVLVEPRDGDKLQARGRVNSLIEAGLLPRPATLPCVECGHTGPDRRHEYHHHKGYSVQHREDVVVLCVKCHRQKDFEKTKPRNENGRFI